MVGFAPFKAGCTNDTVTQHPIDSSKCKSTSNVQYGNQQHHKLSAAQQLHLAEASFLTLMTYRLLLQPGKHIHCLPCAPSCHQAAVDQPH